ncbi:MAG: YceI family protein [Bacteroidetes bacterium]|nr:YceI family protein [Bacteroidota bacterium]MBS1935020.1 YceI family protein [Bacteroidota bacterium]
MKRKIAIIFLVFAYSQYTSAQQYITRNGFIGFYSKTPLEDIKAENNQVYAAVDLSKKNIAFTLLLKGFIFTKELMQEHFNENYVESDKYPKANFVGSYSGNISADKDGPYKVMVKGALTLHNVTKNIEMPATLELHEGKLTGNATFSVKPEDFNINIPSLVRDKIAKEVTVSVKIDCSTSK